ncbi:MAG: TIGR00269 family protein [Candidatus Bathyarchaeota archaeon]|nr:TIGR00269 family protein [Candidatus Bathyarchaeota archaeon]
MSSSADKCSACKRKEPFYHRIYSGERLCRKCFGESIENKVRATIAKYKMLNYNDTVAIGVSGGKDSISLLEVLARLERRFPRAKLVAVTVDEGIKGYRDEALQIAVDACKRWNMPHHIVSFKDLYGYTLDEIVKRAKTRGCELTPCAYCGVLRRKALNIAALNINANKVATGHTLDDEVQTSLLNIFHGDIPKMAAEKPITDKIHPKLIQKVKPFCEIPEKESALYAYLKNINFQSTPCPYASEALRNDIRTLLNRMEERHAGTKHTIYKSIEKLRPAIQQTTQKPPFQNCQQCNHPAAANLCMACQLLKQIQ